MKSKVLTPLNGLTYTNLINTFLYIEYVLHNQLHLGMQIAIANQLYKISDLFECHYWNKHE